MEIPCITSEVYQIGGPGLSAAEDAAVYLVAFGGAHAALIDAGCGSSTAQLMANVEACGVDCSLLGDLFLTHCHFDHAGGAADLQARWGLRVVMHALDAPYVETADPTVTAAAWYGAAMPAFRPDRLLAGERETLFIGERPLEAIHVPGHSPGSVVYLLHSDGYRILFGQDVHGPLHPSLKSDPAAYRQSLHQLLALEADILCEGHFGVIEGPDRVAAFIHRFLP
jgi:glyoxylase-like metal-dependent hydrolase (beta-lactamase superfamily II)